MTAAVWSGVDAPSSAASHASVAGVVALRSGAEPVVSGRGEGVPSVAVVPTAVRTSGMPPSATSCLRSIAAYPLTSPLQPCPVVVDPAAASRAERIVRDCVDGAAAAAVSESVAHAGYVYVMRDGSIVVVQQPAVPSTGVPAFDAGLVTLADTRVCECSGGVSFAAGSSEVDAAALCPQPSASLSDLQRVYRARHRVARVLFVVSRGVPLSALVPSLAAAADDAPRSLRRHRVTAACGPLDAVRSTLLRQHAACATAVRAPPPSVVTPGDPAAGVGVGAWRDVDVVGFYPPGGMDGDDQWMPRHTPAPQAVASTAVAALGSGWEWVSGIVVSKSRDGVRVACDHDDVTVVADPRTAVAFDADHGAKEPRRGVDSERNTGDHSDDDDRSDAGNHSDSDGQGSRRVSAEALDVGAHVWVCVPPRWLDAAREHLDDWLEARKQSVSSETELRDGVPRLLDYSVGLTTVLPGLGRDRDLDMVVGVGAESNSSVAVVGLAIGRAVCDTQATDYDTAITVSVSGVSRCDAPLCRVIVRARSRDLVFLCSF
jgi:hypothetical protein